MGLQEHISGEWVIKTLKTTIGNYIVLKKSLTDLASGGPAVQVPKCVLVKLDMAELNKKSAYELHACASIAPPTTDAETYTSSSMYIAESKMWTIHIHYCYSLYTLV